MHLCTSITRFSLKNLQIFTLLWLTWMPQVQTGSAEVYQIDGIYLVVNNQMMTRSEALDNLESLKNQINRSEMSEDEKQQRLMKLKKGLLKRLVQELLLLDRSQALNVEPPEQEIDARLDDLEENQPGLYEAFSEQELQERMIRDFKKQRVISRDVESRIRANEGEILQFCQKRLRDERRIGLAQILFQNDESSSKEKAVQVRNAFESGTSFKELVEKYSEDPGAARNEGRLGYFQKGELLEVINDTAFALDVGEMSELVHSEFGFHLLYVYDEKITLNINCDKLTLKLKNQYAEILYGRERDLLLEDYLEELWVCARIDVKNPYDSGLPGADLLPKIERPDVECRVRMGAIRKRAMEKARQKQKSSGAGSR